MQRCKGFIVYAEEGLESSESSECSESLRRFFEKMLLISSHDFLTIQDTADELLNFFSAKIKKIMN